MRLFRLGLILVGVTIVAACQSPQHVELAKPLKREAGQSRILVMPADIELQELTAGGVLEPKADWSESAKKYLAAALHEQESARNLTLVNYDEASAAAERRDELHQLFKLYAAVGYGIFNHQFGGPLQLPTKAKGFDWSLGPAMRALGEQYGADYALLTFVRDSYSSAGRQALIAFAALAGVGVQGGRQVAFTSLVDLQTGDIVWFNRIIKTSGDLRNANGARATAAELLVGFPQ
jgi:hypothetical protein